MKEEEKRKTGKEKKTGKDNIPILLYTESEETKEDKIIFLSFCTQKVKKKRGKSKPKRGNQLKRGSLTCLL